MFYLPFSIMLMTLLCLLFFDLVYGVVLFFPYSVYDVMSSIFKWICDVISSIFANMVWKMYPLKRLLALTVYVENQTAVSCFDARLLAC